MRSIRGNSRGWQLLHAKRRKPQKTFWCYKARKNNLSELGYASYYEYLESVDWKKIRERRLSKRPLCQVCKKPANQIHHTSYDFKTLLGLDGSCLIPLCGTCHKEIEFCNNKKLTLHQANKKLSHLIQSSDNSTE